MPVDEVEFSHSPHASGIGVLHANYTERKWHVVNSAFALAIPISWAAEVSYRGRQQVCQPGDIFCTEPGEVHRTSRILQPGGFKVFLIDEAPLLERLAEVAPQLKAVHFKEIGRRMSPTLVRHVSAVVAVIGKGATPLHLQSCVMDLVATMADELFDEPRSQRFIPPGARALERARECLHDDDAGWIDLDTLSQQAGISRFHLLRAFKARFGLPPHAYQVGLRIAKAQRLLRSGVAPAHVATECGFSDQSHLTRHFKQVLGITPGRFARDLALSAIRY